MLLIFCLNLRKDQLQGKPGKYFLARGPVRLGVLRAPTAGKDATGYTYVDDKLCVCRWHLSTRRMITEASLGIFTTRMSFFRPSRIPNRPVIVRLYEL